MNKETKELLDKLRFMYAYNGAGYNSYYNKTLSEAADLIEELTQGTEMKMYNDDKEIPQEALGEFLEYNRQGPQYGVGAFETALITWYACKSYQEYKQKLKDKNEIR